MVRATDQGERWGLIIGPCFSQSGCHLYEHHHFCIQLRASEARAWEALKALGDTALAHGGLQSVLQMFVGTLTGAEEVARVSEEAGHPDTMTPEVIAQWITDCP